ncbi:nicotinate-nucleotide--dimethylbenzimidazole phosphoribosyltransferase [Nocardioides daedukensis]|uniref:Nicotinate-nucleotide--dimethylbenzimidazole phosphoribosyltransferase n=1 Tax=Nocardioides daedukensis TaxID=634462 RepID=A0A7Y9UTA7_9ACTN|nr:nicotinate-nucleotide--dimethylbenzimidazole phosphoribosyltransferase [Nocardioides daedukensis]
MTSPREQIESTLAAIAPLSQTAMRQARERQAQLTKPAGALGALEEVSIQLAGISGSCPPPAPERPAVAVFAGDHGVLVQGVSPWPQEVTVGMVENFRAGGAAVNVLARACGAVVRVIDVGVASEVAGDDVVLVRNVRRGTADLSQGPAMSRAEAERALAAGISVANELADAGHDVLLTGDMGIGNTTPSACLLAALTGTPAEVVTGRGVGIDDDTLALKTRIVADAVARLAPDAEPIDVLSEVGGLEHAGLAGFILGAAARRLPVILDGVIAGSAALVAQALSPEAIHYCMAGHRSVEPGHRTALERLGLRPLVDLDLRLGEGSGAALAFPLVRSAALILDEMATFDSAGVANKDD